MPFANTYHICIWLFPLWWFVLVVKQLPNVSSTSTLLGHWLLACFPKSCGCRTTWEVIWKYLHWQMASTQPGIQTTSLWKRAQWPATASQKIQDCPVGCDRRSWILFQLFGDTCYLTGIALLALLGGAENFIPCAFGKKIQGNLFGKAKIQNLHQWRKPSKPMEWPWPSRKLEITVEKLLALEKAQCRLETLEKDFQATWALLGQMALERASRVAWLAVCIHTV